MGNRRKFYVPTSLAPYCHPILVPKITLLSYLARQNPCLFPRLLLLLSPRVVDTL